MAPSPRRRGQGEDSIYFDASKNRDGLADKRPSTVDTYEHLAGQLISAIGAVQLTDLTPRYVQATLTALSRSLPTRSLRLVHQILERAILHAQASDLIARYVASTPSSRAGDPRGHWLSSRPAPSSIALARGRWILRQTTGNRPTQRREIARELSDRLRRRRHRPRGWS